MDTKNHSTDALALKGSSALAIVLGGIAAADRSHQRYDDRGRIEKQAGNHFPANYFERAGSDQNDVFYELLEVLPYLPATDLFEAAAQVGQALNVINTTYDQLPENKEAEAVFKKMEKVVARLLHSALRVLEQDGGFSLCEQGLSSIRLAHLDPWADVEDVVSKLQAEGVK